MAWLLVLSARLLQLPFVTQKTTTAAKSRKNPTNTLASATLPTDGCVRHIATGRCLHVQVRLWW